MAVSSDLQDLVGTLTIANLANITAPIPTIIIPAGFTDLFVTTIKNNLTNNLGFAPDVQQEVKVLVTNNQVTFVTVP
jgi:hypothetical protein